MWDVACGDDDDDDDDDYNNDDLVRKTIIPMVGLILYTSTRGLKRAKIQSCI